MTWIDLIASSAATSASRDPYIRTTQSVAVGRVQFEARMDMADFAGVLCVETSESATLTVAHALAAKVAVPYKNNAWTAYSVNVAGDAAVYVRLRNPSQDGNIVGSGMSPNDYAVKLRNIRIFPREFVLGYTVAGAEPISTGGGDEAE